MARLLCVENTVVEDVEFDERGTGSGGPREAATSEPGSMRNLRIEGLLV